MSALKSILIQDRQFGTVREATADEIIRAALACIANQMRRGASLASPGAVCDYLVLRFGALQHEVFSVSYLDSRHRVIACQDLFSGTVDGASVHPRDVVKEALQHNAAACILVHNHPSGVAEPSTADEQITQKIRDALALVDIRVVDHVVVAAGGSVSFAEHGLLCRAARPGSGTHRGRVGPSLPVTTSPAYAAIRCS